MCVFRNFTLVLSNNQEDGHPSEIDGYFAHFLKRQVNFDTWGHRGRLPDSTEALWECFQQ